MKSKKRSFLKIWSSDFYKMFNLILKYQTNISFQFTLFYFIIQIMMYIHDWVVKLNSFFRKIIKKSIPE